MITGQWLLGLVTGALALNALFVCYRYRVIQQSHSPAGPETSAGEDGPRTGNDGAVTCRHCGAENEPGYRFCRACVSELPGATGFDRSGNGRTGRASL